MARKELYRIMTSLELRKTALMLSMAMYMAEEQMIPMISAISRAPNYKALSLSLLKHFCFTQKFSDAYQQSPN